MKANDYTRDSSRKAKKIEGNRRIMSVCTRNVSWETNDNDEWLIDWHDFEITMFAMLYWSFSRVNECIYDGSKNCMTRYQSSIREFECTTHILTPNSLIIDSFDWSIACIILGSLACLNRRWYCYCQYTNLIPFSSLHLAIPSFQFTMQSNVRSHHISFIKPNHIHCLHTVTFTINPRTIQYDQPNCCHPKHSELESVFQSNVISHCITISIRRCELHFDHNINRIITIILSIIVKYIVHNVSLVLCLLICSLIAQRFNHFNHIGCWFVWRICIRIWGSSSTSLSLVSQGFLLWLWHRFIASWFWGLSSSVFHLS